MKRKKANYYLQRKMNNGKPPEEILRKLNMTAGQVRDAMEKYKPLIYKP